MSHSLNSVKGGLTGDYIGDCYKGYYEGYYSPYDYEATWTQTDLGFKGSRSAYPKP